MRRRRFIASLAVLAASSAVAQEQAAGTSLPIRIGLTPVFLDNQLTFLSAWRDYFESRLGSKVEFVQRSTYREIVDALRAGAIECGWICGYPFARYAAELRLMAVPLYQGAPLYRSYLIVPATDQRTRSILDLRGKVFAFSDPDSNSGYLYPTFALKRLQERPDAFFRRTFFAWAHRSVVEAVAAELANGGAVDGYVWDTLVKLHPRIADRTRVVSRSPAFGFPPFVAHANLDRPVFDRLRGVLLGMGRDPAGKALLAQLNLDGFVPGEPALFDGIREMMKVVREVPRASPA